MVDRVGQSTAQPEKDEAQRKHEEEMIAVADGNEGNLSMKEKDGTETVVTPGSQEQVASTVTQRPDDIPEKFWDAEKGEVNVAALLKSQQDGEAALRGKTQTPEGDDSTTETKPEGDDETPAADPKVVQDASAEFAEKGELSADTYAALEGQGLSKDMVDQYIDGQTALVERVQNAAFGEFEGGADSYNTAADWAAQNLTEDEIKALDVQITSTNPAIVAQGAKALNEKWVANRDVDPTVTIHGDGGANVTGSYFKSAAEMQTAMSDPKYAKDQAFRDDVAAKIDRAGKAGVNLFA
ncbi:MAG: capsid assembly protein [Planctomycetota bacterium]|jgi:hypothetical protein